MAAHSPYLPADDNGKDTWLTNLAAKIGSYSATLGLSAGDVTSIQADAAFYHWLLTSLAQVSGYAQQWTTFKNNGRNGKVASLGPVPVPPVFATMPAAVAPNIIGRATALVARIKAAPGYTESIGQALQIIGAEQTVDVNSMKPVITLELDAGAVTVGWKKQGMDALEIWVNRGAGFVFLAIDSIPDYTDTAPMPAAGQSALWQYKGIYLQADARVGQWSDVVSIPVAG